MVPPLIGRRTDGPLVKVATSHEIAVGNLPSHLIVHEKGIGKIGFLSQIFSNIPLGAILVEFWVPQILLFLRLHTVFSILSVPFQVFVEHTNTGGAPSWIGLLPAEGRIPFDSQ